MPDHATHARRIVVGSGVAEPSKIFDLVQRAILRAEKAGLSLSSLQRSRNRRSSSSYLTFADAHGRAWLIRISNHRRPRRSGYPVPHFDLVSIDGETGLKQLGEYLDRIVSNEIAWTDAAKASRTLPRRRKARRKRR